ncbi:MAG: thioredoxin [Deltaproteobacteria bacterium CG_4_9_14_3_um_filter_63_12]|nr:MAG: thioredoxin [Deltaproteobacteria bacterium CG17_big_fil_post_rev_8_21_14_2_50_63_7]PJB37422.1 MAG: thioredoxin [Deltaproteobacteria bacterium CG_4_9_14_3_um_filter_63_12]
MAGKNVFEITDGNFQAEVLDAELPVVIDFWAPWCGPCRAIAPLIEQLAERYDGKVKVGKLNVDDNPEVAQKYRITGIPSLIAFKDGEVVDQLVGANPKRINEIFAEIS